MKPFLTITSKITPFPEPNVDTDQIIPKQFLKLVTRSGFGKYLFFDRRGPNFVLDNSLYRGSKVLVAGDNFGCGSSREHAVWALQDFGFAVIISTSFADIFYSNCIKNGILPIYTPDTHTLFSEENSITVSLQDQVIRHTSGVIHFEIDPHHKTTLLEGLDDISRTLRYDDMITLFEQNSPTPSVLL
ncbi:MAG: 3-isopropylmalate dehydratase small subunit [Cenarchaeum sp. SB0664_bin_35]|nr:3-isopropylmalate dehydratase small subunit [Cenarchaeum sp. SB0664_bin_35]